jgi:hypothetical protein
MHIPRIISLITSVYNSAIAGMDPPDIIGELSNCTAELKQTNRVPRVKAKEDGARGRGDRFREI